MAKNDATAYPGRLLSRLSSMMLELMRIAEEIEAHERSRGCTCEASGTGNRKLSAPLPENVILLSQAAARSQRSK